MSSVYLGDIDPNNNLISPLNIRRNILLKLLVWDSIVLSDSQFLTDPRINVLMCGFDSNKLLQQFKMTDVKDEQRGFETLVNHGIVKIASRRKDGKIFKLGNVYDEMSTRPDPIPFLPENFYYADYLDSLSVTKLAYDLDKIAHMFSNNLQSGVGTSRFPNTSRVENELTEMFKNDHINFSTILKYIKGKLQSGEITKEKYNSLYEYVFSCYSINISAQTHCYLSTEFKNIPLHIDCGTGDFKENTFPEKFDTLRKSWALNPFILDEISFEEFIKMKKDLNKIKDIDMIMKCYNGTIADESEYNKFYTAWDTYVLTIELYAKDLLSKKQIELYEKLIKFSDIQLKQTTLLTRMWEVVESWIGMIPIVGDLIDVIGIAHSSKEYVRHLSHKAEWNALLEKKDRIKSLLSPDTRIITKFENCVD